MGECLLVRRGGEVKKLPILNASYPANASIWSGNGATFKVEIAVDGVPNAYAYQWYRDGAIWTNATASAVTWDGASVGSHSVYCVVTNAAGSVKSRTAALTVTSPMPVYTYTGSSAFVNEGSNNWNLRLNSSGTLKFTSFGNWNGVVDLFVLAGGGAGANGGGTAVGGGGYYMTVNKKQLSLNTSYAVTVGNGATAVGNSGSSSSAMGTTVNGGGAATSGSTGYASCQVTSPNGSGGNVYYYSSLSANGVSIGSGVKTVDLYYPITTGQHTNGLTLYKGRTGWYRCSVNSVGTVTFDAGTNGAGASATKIFGTGDTVSGPGETNNASRLGQGGGTNGIRGGNGLAVIRNAR